MLTSSSNISYPTDYSIQVSEEVERALAKFGPARVNGTGRSGCYWLFKFLVQCEIFIHIILGNIRD